MPLFRPFTSTAHLYSLAPHEKNFMCTLKAHLWPGASVVLLLQSYSFFTATSSKATLFICHQQTQNVHVESASLTEPSVLDCHFSESSLLPTASAGWQEGSSTLSRAEGSDKFLLNLLVVPLSHSTLFIQFICKINDDWQCLLLTPHRLFAI